MTKRSFLLISVLVVTACDGDGPAEPEPPVSTAPTAPGDFELSIDPETGHVRVSWSDLSDNEDYYELERSGTRSDGILKRYRLAANATEYHDSTAPANDTVSYRVTACRALPTGGVRCGSTNRTEVLTPPFIEAKVGVLGSGPPVSLKVVAVVEGDSVPLRRISADRYKLVLPRMVEGSVDVIARDANPGSHYVSGIARVDHLMAEDPDIAYLALMPGVWTIQKGVFAGQSVPIDFEGAMDRGTHPQGSAQAMSFWFSMNLSHAFDFDGYGWVNTTSTPLVLRHHGSTDVAPSDSVAFWARVDEFEEILGRDLFHPATQPDPDDGARTVYAYLGAPVVGGRARRYGPDGLLVSTGYFARETAFPGQNRKIDVNFRPTVGGLVEIAPGAAGSRRLVHHELLHVLGAGHGCSWPSIQSPCVETFAGDLTVEDVAHWEVLHEFSQFEEGQTRTTPGLMRAYMAWRVEARGLLPLPEAPLPAPGAGAGHRGGAVN